MKFNWREFLLLAERLSRSDGTPDISEEAFMRAAIGRAYYAAFLAARDAAGKSFAGQDSHQAVQEHYLKRGDKDGRRISLELSRIKDLRIASDYKSRPIVDSKLMARDAISFAQTVLQLL